MILCDGCAAGIRSASTDQQLAPTGAYSVDPCDACGNGSAGHQLYEAHDG